MQEQPNDRSVYKHFLACCEMLGMTDFKDALRCMLTADYIIANEDRHFNNFGLVRNADTLVWQGFAPVYDSGMSLWYEKRPGSHIECKPFRDARFERILLCRERISCSRSYYI